jgi:nucleotidyltransferase AbiEii toxin of type IV toxin-antitoxin system
VRVTFTVFLEKAQIPIQIDIGFGDTITPGPNRLSDTLGSSESSPPAYPRETVVSEKLEAMVKLGIANSRMKDFHDLHSLSITFEFDGKTLTEAVRATFKQRGTELPPDGVPLAFTSEFFEDEKKVKQWNAFCNKNKTYVQQTAFTDIIARLASFLVPVIRSAQQERVPAGTWTPVHDWQPAPDQ